MNLTLFLNTAPTASLASAPANTGENTPEMAAFQDFLALVGLPPMAVDGLEGAAGEGEQVDGGALMPDMTGNSLPPALPVLPPILPPVLPDSATGGEQVAGGGQGLPGGLPAGAHTQAASATLPDPADARTRQPAAASTTTAAVPFALGQMPALPDPAAPAASARAMPEPRPAGLQVELVALAQTAAAAPQAQPPATPPMPSQVPQPVLAQLLQSQTRSGDGRSVGPASADGAPQRAPVAIAATDTDMAQDTETLRPVAGPAGIQPVPAPAMQAPAVQPVIPVADMAVPAAAPSASPSGEAAAPRHDFTAVVEKLAEARELARPGRAEMHMAHREFGQVSVRFDLAGDALKVAMSSPDAAFAPAVQAALAERSGTPLVDAARPDTAPQRTDIAAPTASGQPGPQADGQRGEPQQRSAAARSPADQVQRQREGDDAASRQPAPDRDGSLFA